ncbi:MAG: homogentisate 1,2-dioxygenase [Planctomycetes bacterium]|nr:homogentisate 1,2-dioxygenase [Planctomycetota bacterium]
MIQYHKLGDIPPKHHVTHRENGKLLMEQCMTRVGFDSTYSILYYRTPPTDEFKVKAEDLPDFCPVEANAHQLLHRRHLRTQDLKPRGDYLLGRRTVLMNDDLRIGIVKTNAPAAKSWFSNAEGDECWFAYEGGGVLESVYGILPFRKHDYVIIPKGTPYRLHPENDKGTFLVFESSSYIDVPKQFRNECGQITMDAPYCHRDFRVPRELLVYDEGKHGTAPFKHYVKYNNRISVHEYQHFPWDVVGWDGVVYPVAFNIHDYQPRTGAIHLPPTIHITFAGRGFIICSFVPRKVDYFDRDGHRAIPCPYGHASVDCDEILYYVEGNFTSRKGIDQQSISLHPMGVPHGPHPGTYERSVGISQTAELAVMCDTFKPLRLTKVGSSIEEKDYHYSWVRRENEAMETSK